MAKKIEVKFESDEQIFDIAKYKGYPEEIVDPADSDNMIPNPQTALEFLEDLAYDLFSSWVGDLDWNKGAGGSLKDLKKKAKDRLKNA
jgi:hypothetical protein